MSSGKKETTQLDIPDTAPITLIFPSPELSSEKELKYKERLAIDQTQGLYHIDRLKSGMDPKAIEIMEIIFPNNKGKFDTVETIRDLPTVVRQLTGMIDTAVKLDQLGVRTVLKYPESGLHPTNQCQIADALIYFASQDSRTIVFDGITVRVLRAKTIDEQNEKDLKEAIETCRHWGINNGKLAKIAFACGMKPKFYRKST